MDYIVCRRIHKPVICGDINLKHGTICEQNGDYITDSNTRPICSTNSQDAYDYFARNDDEQGTKRFFLTHDILKKTENKDDSWIRLHTKQQYFDWKRTYDKIWSKIWLDKKLAKFKRPEYQNFWIWNYDFYNASIEDLEYIEKLIEEV